VRGHINPSSTIISICRSTKENEKWFLLRKQLRQFTQSTQQELEQERAELLSQNAMLQQENKELQTYIDSHLDR